MALKTCLDNARAISIIPRTGVQFLDFGFADADERLPKEWDCFDENKSADFADVGEFSLVNRDGEPMTRALSDRAVSYVIARRDVLDFVKDRWLPMPLFRRSGDDFSHGPTNWVRIRTVQLEKSDENGLDYRVVVAVDTNLMAEVEGHAYLAPSPADAQAGLPFGLVSAGQYLQWFLDERWVRAWVLQAFREMVIDNQRAKSGVRLSHGLSDEDMREEIQGVAEPLLRYAAFLDMLEQAQVFPEVFKLVDTLSGQGLETVACDLVLDLGNSRTCGLIVESDPDHGADVSQADILEVRDLSKPEHVYAEPFESRIEFAYVNFGKTDLSHDSGRSDAFEWPTITRLGFEASRLAGGRVGNEGNSGMSSPKRYLWNTDAPAQQWRVNASTMPGDSEPFAAQGAFAVLVNDLGQALHRMAHDDPDRLPAMEARYSRSSLVAFVLAEVFAHALMMINSPAHRFRRPNSDNPRRLRRVIMTMPSALPLAERAILKERAEEARDLVFLGLGTVMQNEQNGVLDWAGAGIAEPEIVLQWDEASATQLVYLYTRVVKHFFGHAPACFDTLRRPGSLHTHGLRLATLDIGGGTSDLVISDFDCEGQGNSVTIFPEQRFREGFSIAGDDVVLRIIQEQVLKCVEAAMEQAGASPASAIMATLFGGDRAGMDVADRLKRQQFASQVAMPIAIGLLSRYESAQSLTEHVAPVPFVDFFDADHQPSESAIDYLNKETERRGGHDFDLRALEFPVVLADIDKTIRSALAEVLNVLSEIIAYYGADILLISGRPSRLTAVSDMLNEALPMMTGRIVPLHSFRVGQWYPFRDKDGQGRIDDPKTTAAVGAMICAMAEGRIEHFNFRSDRIDRPASTARYIGKLDRANSIPHEDTYYSDLNLDDDEQAFPEETFEFRGPLALGFRQFPNEWWPATRLYTLDYASEADGRELHSRTPIRISLGRPKRRNSELLSENLEIVVAEDSVRNRNVRNQLRLKLQTLDDSDGYWLDTGVLRTDD